MPKRLLAALAVLLPVGAFAAGVDTDALLAITPADPYAEAVKLVDAGSYEEAIAKLLEVVAEDPEHADALNHLGYSHRKLGRLDEARHHYEQALAIEPDHLGALEYLGELHVERGDLGEAEVILRRLTLLCPQGCEERDDLAQAIEERKGGGAGS